MKDTTIQTPKIYAYVKRGLIQFLYSEGAGSILQVDTS